MISSFFFETDDGRVMLSYSNGRFYTKKELVMQIPYPIPRGYGLLKTLSANDRVAVRVYRKYLSEQGVEIPAPAQKEEKESERQRKLKEATEINASRWKNGKREMSARTKELRDGVVAKMVLGVGAKK